MNACRIVSENRLIFKLINTISPAIDSNAFPNASITDDDCSQGGTWSSTTHAFVPGEAWFFLLEEGSAYADAKTYSFFVRLVRSGQSLASFDLLGVPPDTTPPVTADPTLSSGPTQTTAGISVTTNEAGTG